MIIKSMIMLYMYDLLIEGNEFTIDEIVSIYNISVRTYRRYIAEINNFLCEQYKQKEVVFSKEKRTYYLSKIK